MCRCTAVDGPAILKVSWWILILGCNLFLNIVCHVPHGFGTKMRLGVDPCILSSFLDSYCSVFELVYGSTIIVQRFYLEKIFPFLQSEVTSIQRDF